MHSAARRGVRYVWQRRTCIVLRYLPQVRSRRAVVLQCMAHAGKPNTTTHYLFVSCVAQSVPYALLESTSFQDTLWQVELSCLPSPSSQGRNAAYATAAFSKANRLIGSDFFGQQTSHTCQAQGSCQALVAQACQQAPKGGQWLSEACNTVQNQTT
jgi:hypothetical protein